MLIKVINEKKNSIFHLDYKSQKQLYNKFFFYNSSIFFQEKGRIKPSFKRKNVTSFQDVLKNHPLFQETSAGLEKARVLCINNSFLYLDTRTKSTVIKPKFKIVFPNSFHNLVKKDILLSSFHTFYGFLKLIDLKGFIQIFCYSPLKKNVHFNELHLKKLIIIYKYSKRFFFFKLIKSIFSKSQKKINFLQFNIFFKKYKYNILEN